MGGALGVAALASPADARTENLLESGDALPAALTGGYDVGFLLEAVIALAAAAVGAALRTAAPPAEHGREEAIAPAPAAAE